MRLKSSNFSRRLPPRIEDELPPHDIHTSGNIIIPLTRQKEKYAIKGLHTIIKFIQKFHLGHWDLLSFQVLNTNLME